MSFLEYIERSEILTKATRTDETIKENKNMLATVCTPCEENLSVEETEACRDDNQLEGSTTSPLID